MSDCIQIQGFRYLFQIFDPDGTEVRRAEGCNLIPQAGLAFLLRAPFGDVSPISAFYCGLWRGNVVPSAGLTATDIPATLQEFVGYSETTRPIWTREHDGIGTLDNENSQAEFNFTQSATLYGSLLASDSTKGGNSGLLLSCFRFPTPMPAVAGQRGLLTTGVTYVPSSIA
jgi:hypothetical protein